MRIKQLLTKTLLAAAGLCVGASAWAEDWSTVWTTDFSSAPSGMTYSVSNGSTNIDNGYINYQQGGGSGDRAINTAFTASEFNVSTNWKLEFDWNCGSANSNSSNVSFATDQGNAFTLTWAKYASAVVVTDASSTEICTTLPLLGYKQTTCASWSHFTIIGDTEKGVYLTITNGATTYVNNVLVSSTFGYPKTFNGTLGKAVSSMFIDNVSFATPKVAGYVAPPTSTITAPAGTDRKFTLSCLTDGATIYYAESDLEIGAAGWTTYSTEVTTSAATIYAYASDGVNNSEKINFSTGAGTAITLNAPTITLSGVAQSGSVYYPVVTVASNQSGLELVPASPSLSYKFNDASVSASSPYTFTGVGKLTVTVSADGFTSNSADYEVTTSYVKTKTIDLAAITAGDLSTVWTKTSDAAQLPASNWISRYSSETFPLYIYDYTSDDAAKTDVVEGLIVNISSKDADPGVTPTLYVGAGMILPSMKVNNADLSGSSTWNTSMNISVNGATAEQIAVYTYPTNYGQSTSTKTIAANENYGLYRLSDMLTKVEVYSPASVSVEVTSAGMATYVPTYDLDFSETGIKAYKAKVTAQGVCTLTEVDNVPAGTPVLLVKDGGATEDIPVMTGAAAVSDNDLVAGTGAAVATEDGEYTNMILNNIDGNVGFYFAAGNTVATNRAYLHFASSLAPAAEVDGARHMVMVFGDDDTTGIQAVNGETQTVNAYYNLSGQRVSQPAKGLYIVNGKKVIIK